MFKPICFDGYHGDNITSLHDMQAAGIKLIIMKASQGFSDDSAFRSILDRAKSINMLVGGYHFGINADGSTQADHFMSLLQPGELMVLDFEPFPKSQMTVAQAEAFVIRVMEKTGVLPLLYGSLAVELHDNGKIAHNSILLKCPFWIPRYGNNAPVTIPGTNMVMWQFTGDGIGPEPHTIAGCSNNADLSVWSGNPDDLPAFVAKHSFSLKSGT